MVLWALTGCPVLKVTLVIEVFQALQDPLALRVMRVQRVVVVLKVTKVTEEPLAQPDMMDLLDQEALQGQQDQLAQPACPAIKVRVVIKAVADWLVPQASLAPKALQATQALKVCGPFVYRLIVLFLPLFQVFLATMVIKVLSALLVLAETLVLPVKLVPWVFMGFQVNLVPLALMAFLAKWVMLALQVLLACPVTGAKSEIAV